MPKEIKCLVWDLDDTMWLGTLLEDDRVALRPDIKRVVTELDRRGILQSVSSKNYEEDAMSMLHSYELGEYFLYPQISFNPKSAAIGIIAEKLNIGFDSIAFVDDREYERAEVHAAHPEVMLIDAADYASILDMPEFNPEFVTEDSVRRRAMYLEDDIRQSEEREFEGTNEEFLKTLGMELTISKVRHGDLERVSELTKRTNQLNSTGLTYDFDELSALIDSEDHVFLIAELTDKFGSYGKIGLALLEKGAETLDIRLMLMSCRVMNRGIGSAMLIHMTHLAGELGLDLCADFQHTDRNRVMYITYKFMGFEDTDEDAEVTNLRYSGAAREFPDYLKVIVENS